MSPVALDGFRYRRPTRNAARTAALDTKSGRVMPLPDLVILS